MLYSLANIFSIRFRLRARRSFRQISDIPEKWLIFYNAKQNKNCSSMHKNIASNAAALKIHPNQEWKHPPGRPRATWLRMWRRTLLRWTLASTRPSRVLRTASPGTASWTLNQEWKHQPGRPRATWLRTVEKDLAPLNLGFHAAWQCSEPRHLEPHRELSTRNGNITLVDQEPPGWGCGEGPCSAEPWLPAAWQSAQSRVT